MKKSLIKIIFILGITWLSIHIVFAQARSITETDYEALQERHRQSAQGKNFRSVYTLEVIEPDTIKPIYLETRITEIGLPHDSRYFIEERRKGESTTSESINANNKSYVREGKGKWIVTDNLMPRGEINTTETGTRQAKYDSTIYRKLEHSILDGRQVDVYEIVYTISSTVNGATTQMETSKRIWVNNDGIIVKTVVKSGNENQIQKISTWLYDYESKIVVTAPIL